MCRRILFIGGGLSGGGQERGLTGFANFYARHGHQVTVVNLFDTERFFELDKRIRVFWPGRDRNKFGRLVYAFILIPFVRRAVRETTPDVLLSFGEWFNPFVIFATRFLGVPLFVFDRMGPELELGFLVGTARRILYRLATGVVVQTNTARMVLGSKTGVKNITVVPNPVNVIDAEDVAKVNQIVTIGRLSREKGHIVLIRAFSLLTQNEWTLQIVGDGPERARLEREVAALAISERVVFHGHQQNLDRVLGRSEIFVLPSFYEGFPNALLEAMSVPIACISSDCVAGPSDIIKDGINGLLVEPGNVEELAGALGRLIDNRLLRVSLATEALRVRDRFAFARIANQLLDLLFPPSMKRDYEGFPNQLDE